MGIRHMMDSRGTTGAHVSPTQPFALFYDIALTPAVRELPHFLKDCDELSRQMSCLHQRDVGDPEQSSTLQSDKIY
jgi:hypothetical protein